MWAVPAVKWLYLQEFIVLVCLAFTAKAVTSKLCILLEKSPLPDSLFAASIFQWEACYLYLLLSAPTQVMGCRVTDREILQRILGPRFFSSQLYISSAFWLSVYAAVWIVTIPSENLFIYCPFSAHCQRCWQCLVDSPVYLVNFAWQLLLK